MVVQTTLATIGLFLLILSIMAVISYIIDKHRNK